MTADPSDSIAFRAARETAKAMLGDPAALHWLMQVVEVKLRAGEGTAVATHVHLDIAEAIVEAHVEELLEPGLSDDRRAQLLADPRCLLVVATLYYVTMPTCPVQGTVDELEILRWATDVVRYDMPVG
ncbi:hypothetical protein [Flexivirga sp. B27]